MWDPVASFSADEPTIFFWLLWVMWWETSCPSAVLVRESFEAAMDDLCAAWCCLCAVLYSELADIWAGSLPTIDVEVGFGGLAEDKGTWLFSVMISISSSVGYLDGFPSSLVRGTSDTFAVSLLSAYCLWVPLLTSSAIGVSCRLCFISLLID